MDGLISIAAIIVILLVTGTALGLIRRDSFSIRWLLVAAALVLINDLLLTRAYGLIPSVLPDSDWNWEGKILALTATLAIAALPAFGWRRVGLTLRQAPGSWKAAIPVAILYCAFFAALALAFPSEAGSPESIAFQLTMPGFEEEPFYRGILLFALAQAFTARVRFLGVEWNWGAILSCVLFGLAHAFGYSDGTFSFDPLFLALTAVPSLLAVWLVLRTRSLALPILLHNFGNAISYLL
ncbi:CPBP family intramembrane glutamic endopeptidase [Sphingopyxis sp. L1A2A]|uniref:CPBP family intramembrane glutamic endopeptidase, BDIM_20840 family n=1 Tax=Sphingopyxis sp. L1A2A TaxID=2502247 RepID=UPI0010F79BAD|nr:CPBP family intramembrane glutamic endopeptidase [Sphingopyxis sp. L1A2A]